MPKPARILLPMFIIFSVFTISFLLFSSSLNSMGISSKFLIGSNILFFLISILSFFIHRNGLQGSNPHKFVRSVMGGMLFKMSTSIIALIAYNYMSGESFNKKSVFASLFLYIIYLVVEVAIIMKLNKKPDA